MTKFKSLVKITTTFLSDTFPIFLNFREFLFLFFYVQNNEYEYKIIFFKKTLNVTIRKS